MANGEAVPISVIGTANSTSTEANAPIIAPICSWSNAAAATRSTGLEITGISPTVKPAHARMRAKVRGLGERSAQAPPKKFPAVR